MYLKCRQQIVNHIVQASKCSVSFMDLILEWCMGLFLSCCMYYSCQNRLHNPVNAMFSPGFTRRDEESVINTAFTTPCLCFPPRMLSYNIDSLPLQWRHNERDGVSNHRRLYCLLNRLFRRRSKKTSTQWVTGLRDGNSLVTGEFPAQRASNAENVSIWWRHHYCRRVLSSLVQLMACRLFGAKPLLELILNRHPKTYFS